MEILSYVGCLMLPRGFRIRPRDRGSRSTTHGRLSVEVLEARTQPAVLVEPPFVNPEGDTEFRLIRDGFHFGTLLYTDQGEAAFRPHPDLTDVNGFGSTFYFGPYLGPSASSPASPGGRPMASNPIVTANTPENTVSVQLQGPVNRDPNANFGTWVETLTIGYDPLRQAIHGTGNLTVTLSAPLMTAEADLNLGKVASNYLVNVPRQGSTVGNTGDTDHVDVSFAVGSDPRDFTWVPVQGTTFPQDTSPRLQLDFAAAVNTVDTIALQVPPPQIAVARKPSLAVTYASQDQQTVLSAGLSYAASKSQDPFADNVEGVHQVRRAATAATMMTFAITLDSTPVDVTLLPAPAVAVEQSAGQSDPAGAAPIRFDVRFTQPVTGFDSADVILGGTAGATSAVVTNPSGDAKTYTVAVSGMTAAGTVSLRTDVGAARNLSGVSSPASTSVDNVVFYDPFSPLVTADQAAGQADPSAAGPIQFIVKFSEPVTGFDASDVSFGGSTVSGTLAAQVANPSGDRMTYFVTVTGVASAGEVAVSVLGGAALGDQGQPSRASSSGDNRVTILPPPPTPLAWASGPANGLATQLLVVDGALTTGDSVPVFPASEMHARTATADVTGDGVPDLVGGTGPGAALVRVLDGRSGQVFATLAPFEAAFTGGVYVAAADLDRDGKAEVIITPDQGGGPVVVVYSGAFLASGSADAAQWTRFYGIDDRNFRGGARPALGDMDGDGLPELIVAAGILGGPRVAVYRGSGILASPNQTPQKLLGDFFAFENTVRNGAFVSAGDVTGDGKADLAFGGGPGGAPRVRMFDGAALLEAGPFTNLDDIPAAQRSNFFAGGADLRGGVRLLFRDVNGDGRAELLAGSGDGEASRIRVYLSTTLLRRLPPAPDQELDPFGTVLPNGVFVG